jgi:hypothetical protein
MEDANVVARELVSLVQASPGSTSAGVQLATLVRHRFPDFKPVEYSCRNLRHFIAQYAPQIKEIGRAGADIMYGIRSEPQHATETPEATVPVRSHRAIRRLDPYVWKAFTNPASAFRVHANLSTGELRSEPAATLPVMPWVLVAPVTGEVHLQIARSFAAALHDLQKRVTLEGLLSQPMWWTKFFAVSMSLGLGADWNAFRGRRLMQELEKALAVLGIPGYAAGEGQQADRYASTSTAPATDSPMKGDEQLRRVIISVVKKLPTTELRSLRLPVGEVVDALNFE